MTKRKVLAMIIALALCVSLCSCEAQPQVAETNDQPTTETFVVVAHGKIGDNTEQFIMYDSDTMVMYIYLDGVYSGTMSVLYNADGTLKLYSPEN